MAHSPRRSLERPVGRRPPGVEGLEDRSTPATFSVTSAADAGPGTLRQAILDANSAAGADVIQVGAVLTGGTIALATSLPAITDTIAINGPTNSNQAGIIISGQNTPGVRPFEVAAGAQATLRHMTITGGNVGGNGGGLLTAGPNTVLFNVAVYGNTVSKGHDGGGISNAAGGKLAVTSSLIIGNQAGDDGGGINSDGSSVTITASTIADNQSNFGGGLNTTVGTMLLVSTLVARNTAAASTGGGVRVASGTADALRAIDCTFVGNVCHGGAGGGAIGVVGNGAVTVTNSTIVGNADVSDSALSGGGISRTGPGALNVINSIIAQNVHVTATNNDLSPGAINGLNIGNFIGGNPRLGPLQEDGGPTRTMAPLAGSPVIDAGENAPAPGEVQTATVTGGAGNFTLSFNGATTGAVPWNATALEVQGELNGLPTIGGIGGSLVVTLAGSVYTITFGGTLAGTDVPQLTATGSGGATVGVVTTVGGGVQPLPVTDQRGFLRVVGPTVDIGAVEYQSPGASVTVSSAANPAVAGTAITFTAAVTPSGTGPNNHPTGSVVFNIDGSTVSTVPLSPAGTAAYTTSTLTPGTHAVSVNFLGDANFNPAFDSLSQGISPLPNTPPTVSDLGDRLVPRNGTSGSIAFTVGDTETAVAALTVTAASSNPTLLPASGIVLGGSEATRTVTIIPAADQSGTVVITLTVSDAGGLTVSDTFTVTVPAPPHGVSNFAVGPDAGLAPAPARFFHPDATEQFTLTPFDASFAGGVRVAAADFTGDGEPDLVVGTGPGVATSVRVFDGVTRAELFSTAPFEEAFTGGVFVAAGDLTGDGKADLVITPDEGGGPRVRVFSGAGFGQVADFLGIDDPAFRGGARAAVGDVSGDGVGDLLVAAGFGGGPRLAVFDGVTLATTPTRLLGDFFVFEQTLRNGVYVAAGDLNGDAFAEVIVGGGPGGGPRVFALSGKDLLTQTQTQLANFFAGDPANSGGVRLAVKDLDGDSKADLVTGAGTDGGTRVTAYLGTNIAANGTPPPQFEMDTFSDFTGGVFVG